MLSLFRAEFKGLVLISHRRENSSWCLTTPFQPPAETSDSPATKDGVNGARGHSCREIDGGGGRQDERKRGRRVRGLGDLRQWDTVSQELETHRPQTALANKETLSCTS